MGGLPVRISGIQHIGLTVPDMEEAVAWVKRCPNPMPGPSEIEIRPIYELADFAENVTPEALEIHERTREKLQGG